MAARSKNTLLQCFSTFKHNPAFSDFTIVCEERQWAVHRLVLALHSQSFAAACSKNFKEASEQQIDLSEDHEPACVEALVYYMYNLDYDHASNCLRHTVSELSLHVQVCILADKYDIDCLKELAIDKFYYRAKGWARTREFAEAAELAYEALGPTTEICKAIIDFAIGEKALTSNAAGGQSALRKVMSVTPELATDYATALEAQFGSLVIKQKNEERLTCPTCHRTAVYDKDAPNMWCSYCRNVWYTIEQAARSIRSTVVNEMRDQVRPRELGW